MEEQKQPKLIEHTMILKSLQQLFYFSTSQTIHSPNWPASVNINNTWNFLPCNITPGLLRAWELRQLPVQNHSFPTFPSKGNTQHLLFMSFPDKSFSAEEGLFLFDTESLEDSCWSAGRGRVPGSAVPRGRALVPWLSCPSSPAWFWLLAVLWGLESSSLSSRLAAGGEEPNSCCLQGDTGSARELCFTVFRLWARMRDHVVEWKLSASNQNFTRCSILRSSMNWMK